MDSSAISTITRSVLALSVVVTLCAMAVLQIDVQTWFVVLASSMVAFFFGHVNGKSEANTIQAAKIAQDALGGMIRRNDLGSTGTQESTNAGGTVQGG